jgi:hypothetical protein
VVTRGMPRDMLRHILDNCSGILPPESACGRDVIGTVAKEKYGEDLELHDIEIAQPAKAAPAKAGPAKARPARH